MRKQQEWFYCGVTGWHVVQEKAQQNFEVSMGISAHEVTLEQLADEIAQVYERCGFDRDATVSTLQMLTNIEVSLLIHTAHSA